MIATVATGYVFIFLLVTSVVYMLVSIIQQTVHKNKLEVDLFTTIDYNMKTQCFGI